MQAADLWDLDHFAKRGRLDSSADRRILFERQMRTAPVVVCKILLQGSGATLPHGRPGRGPNTPVEWTRSEADAGVQESLLAEQRVLGSNLAERRVRYIVWEG